MNYFSIALLLAINLTSASPADLISLIMRESGYDPGNFFVVYSVDSTRIRLQKSNLDTIRTKMINSFHDHFDKYHSKDGTIANDHNDHDFFDDYFF